MAYRTKSINLHFMVSEQERDMIQKRMEQSGIRSMRAYLLKQAIDGHVVELDQSSVREMVRLLSNVSNNVNQIARRINANGSLYAADIEDLRGYYDQLWAQAKDILKQLSKL